jgi:hypothetical protein
LAWARSLVRDFPGIISLQSERFSDTVDDGGNIPALLRLDDRVEQLPPVGPGSNNRSAQPAIKAARFHERRAVYGCGYRLLKGCCCAASCAHLPGSSGWHNCRFGFELFQVSGLCGPPEPPSRPAECLCLSAKSLNQLISPVGGIWLVLVVVGLRNEDTVPEPETVQRKPGRPKRLSKR